MSRSLAASTPPAHPYPPNQVHTSKAQKIPKKAAESRTKRVAGKRHWTERIGTAFSRARIRLVEEDPDWQFSIKPRNREKWEEYVINHTVKGEPIDDGFGRRKHWLQQGDKVGYTRPKEHQEIIGLWKQGITKSEERQTESEGENQRPNRQGFLNQLREEKEQVKEGHYQREQVRHLTDREAVKTQPIPKAQQQSPIAQQSPTADQIKSSAEQARVQDFFQKLREQREMAGLEKRSFSTPKPLASESSKEMDGTEASTRMEPLQSLPINEPHTREIGMVSSPKPLPSSPSSQAMTHEIKTTRPIILGLEKINALLSELGNPQDQLKAVHVAGTNGKGSVCAYLTSSLVASGLNVGQFTSPPFNRSMGLYYYQ